MAGFQEIGLRIKADTKEAEKSIRNLEKEFSKLSDIGREQRNQSMFFSDDDIRNFDRMSKKAEDIYRNFYNNFQRISRELERKKQELNRAIEQGMSQQKINNLQSQINQLRAQRDFFQLQMSAAQQFGHIPPLPPTGGGGSEGLAPTFLGFLGGGLRRFLGGLAATFAFSNLYGMAREGLSVLEQGEAALARLGVRVPGYGSAFNQAFEDFQATGRRYGYGALETIQVGEQFISIGGARNLQTALRDVGQIQEASRAMGLDPMYLASVGGFMRRIGALEDGEQRKFAELIAGAIKRSGMTGREKEFIDSIQALTSQLYSTQMKVTEGEMRNVVGFQTLMHQAGFTGERAQTVIGQMNAALFSKNPELLKMLGWGTEFQGASGLRQVYRLAEQGITNPETARRYFTYLDRMFATEDEKILRLMQDFGLSEEQATAFYRQKDAIKSGRFTEGDLRKIMEEGRSAFASGLRSYEESQAARRAQTEANLEATKEAGGEIIDFLKQTFLGPFSDLPESAQWAGMIAGAGLTGLAGGLLGGRLAAGLGGGVLGRLFGRGAAGAAGGAAARGGLGAFGRNLGRRLFGGGLLKGLGKLGSRAIPFLGWGLLAWDVLGAIGDTWGGEEEQGASQAPGGETDISRIIKDEEKVVERRLQAMKLYRDSVSQEAKNLGLDPTNPFKSIRSLSSSLAGANTKEERSWWDSLTDIISKVFPGAGFGMKLIGGAVEGIMDFFGLNGMGGDASQAPPSWNANAVATASSARTLSVSPLTINVNVSGSIEGLTPENNTLVANSLVQAFQNGIDLRYEFKQGIGGDR